ncbi:hypothetical protein KM043_008723 [Ampulex compressa]|nr:hypothetical protein KM043_008723 [Ampulex compressa]
MSRLAGSGVPCRDIREGETSRIQESPGRGPRRRSGEGGGLLTYGLGIVEFPVTGGQCAFGTQCFTLESEGSLDYQPATTPASMSTNTRPSGTHHSSPPSPAYQPIRPYFLVLSPFRHPLPSPPSVTPFGLLSPATIFHLFPSPLPFLRRNEGQPPPSEVRPNREPPVRGHLRTSLCLPRRSTPTVAKKRIFDARRNRRRSARNSIRARKVKVDVSRRGRRSSAFPESALRDAVFASARGRPTSGKSSGGFERAKGRLDGELEGMEEAVTAEGRGEERGKKRENEGRTGEHFNRS